MKKKSAAAKGKLGPRTKITIIPGKGVSQAINYMLEDRDELAVGVTLWWGEHHDKRANDRNQARHNP